MKNKQKEQKQILDIYISKFFQKRSAKINWIKVLIISVLAALMLFGLVKEDMQYDLFIGYIGSWIVCFFIVTVIYYVLPNKEKWLVKPYTKKEIAQGTLVIMKRDQALLKEQLLEKRKSLAVLEKEAENNKSANVYEILGSKRGEIVSLRETIDNREIIMKKVKDLRFGSKVFFNSKK